MNTIENLKKRVLSLAPAQVNDYPKSSWERMSPEEQRADCRKWIEIWLKYNGETITEEEMQDLITRSIEQAESMTSTQKADSRAAVRQMSDAEIASRAREIITGRGSGNDHD